MIGLLLFLFGTFKAFSYVDKSYGAKSNFYITFYSYLTWITYTLIGTLIVKLLLIDASTYHNFSELINEPIIYFGTIANAMNYINIQSILIMAFIMFFIHFKSYEWIEDEQEFGRLNDKD